MLICRCLPGRPHPWTVLRSRTCPPALHLRRLRLAGRPKLMASCLTWPGLTALSSAPAVPALPASIRAAQWAPRPRRSRLARPCHPPRPPRPLRLAPRCPVRLRPPSMVRGWPVLARVRRRRRRQRRAQPHVWRRPARPWMVAQPARPGGHRRTPWLLRPTLSQRRPVPRCPAWFRCRLPRSPPPSLGWTLTLQLAVRWLSRNLQACPAPYRCRVLPPRWLTWPAALKGQTYG